MKDKEQKERVAAWVAEVGRFIADHCSLTDPCDVSKNHVELAYEVLWTNYDKFSVEMYSDRFKVNRAICNAIEEFNLAFVEETFVPYYYAEEDAA